VHILRTKTDHNIFILIRIDVNRTE